ncbi:unnamed protein product [Lymnaea stagnalis]|uniref:Galaxin-like repeats domain-containing protein n=1 Tax=Lymnaea stagnalis TaxID=6523 RepID=A0AAV2H0E4_LYMST
MSILNLKIPVHRIGLLFSTLWLFNGLLGSLAKNSMCSNWELYDHNYQICCKDKVQNRLKNQECCDGNQFYNTDVSLCCENTVMDRFITYVCPHNQEHCEEEELVQEKCSPNDVNCQEQMCCGKDVISKEDFMCCFGHKIALTSSQREERDYLKCCNESSLFDVRSEVCCGKKKRSLDNHIDCCGDMFYRRDTGNCLFFMNEAGDLKFDIGNKSEGICGDRKYNKNNNGCCSGVLNNVPEYDPDVPKLIEPNPNFSCCDSLVMNPVEEKCCRNHHYPKFHTHIIPNRPELKCCGNGFYNTSQETCYDGKSIKIRHDKLLCGGSHFDPELYGCCFNKHYDKDTEFCCDGSLNITVIPKNFICCNGVGISDDHLCCDDTMPLKKSHPDDNECCYNGREAVATFNAFNDQRCVNGAVIEGYKKGTEPCGPRGSYNVATEICCKGHVINKSEGDQCCDTQAYNSDTHQCCSDKVINAQTQQCCYGVISNISPKDGRCCYNDATVYKFDDLNNPCIENCSGLPYDGAYEVCCEGNIYNYEEEFSCCGGSYIDSSTVECCAGNAYQSKPQYECCGIFYVDMREKSCCSGAYPYKFGGNIQCCDDRELYDTRLSQCNLNKVVSKFSDTQNICLLKDLKTFDQITKHGCSRKFGFKATVETVQIKRRSELKPDIVELYLTRVQRLKNMKQLPNFGSNQTLLLKVFVKKHNKVKCRRRYFKKMEIIVLLDQKADRNTINVMENSKLFISKYSKRAEKLISEVAQSCRSK